VFASTSVLARIDSVDRRAYCTGRAYALSCGSEAPSERAIALLNVIEQTYDPPISRAFGVARDETLCDTGIHVPGECSRENATASIPPRGHWAQIQRFSINWGLHLRAMALPSS
jgi:hypothetical protein